MRWRTLVGAVVIALAACGGPNKGTGSDEAGGGHDTLVVAQLFEPNGLDPALESHVAQFVIAAPMFETLVRVEPGTGDVVPGLARSWEPGDGGRAWTFNLRPGVEFHDGTRLDAAAVCVNFERWYRFTGVARHLSPRWAEVMGGYATSDDPTAPPSLYRSCEARTEDEVTIHLTRPDGTLIPSLAVPAFAIASPEALRRYGADKVGGTPEQPTFEGTFATEHPTGTGPFRFESWTRNDRVVLVRNSRYWGPKPALERIVVRRIDNGTARRQAFESGEADVYLPVDPADEEPLRRSGAVVVEHPVPNVGYVVMNSRRPPLDDVRVRQAVAYAVDVPKLLRAKYPPSAVAAEQFLPPALWGRAPDVPSYRHDPDRARRLLTEAAPSDRTLEFWYPTTSIGPALPDAEAVFLAVKADLEAVGFTVEGRPAATVADYFARLHGGSGDLSLDNAFAFLVDPDALLGVFRTNRSWYGFDDTDLLGLLERARAELDRSRRAPLYEQASRLLMERLPVLPFVHVRPAIALAPEWEGYEPSPLPWEGLTAMRRR